MRLFIGIPLAATVVNELMAISRRLRSGADGLRWMVPESWHITLQFLGATERKQYDCTVKRLHELHQPPVPLSLEGLGCFDRTGILFAGVWVSPELRLLQQRVAKAMELCGFLPEDRPYKPHITLARSKGKGQERGIRELKDKISRQPNFSRFVAGEFLLYESFLGAGGSRYEVRERFPLDGN